jgi:hypothetical protein
MVLIAGLLDVVSSLYAWNYTLLKELNSSLFFLWIPYWLILLFLIRRSNVYDSVKLWLPRVAASLLFAIPISNLLHLASVFVFVMGSSYV